ncbi:DUF2256 domain-containing protein [Hymenobacter busanensis]|uniref:DUF2256 domain-containing protein n=2 Tax=Hymenobacter busanensis TaxID=2607656 RepID=A0A7L4ZTK7_9BACT|nr:DUF2256 domain-containing protein [Hymenobacter busanensis]KAA9339526.1 DUF2256 domain-containing protein [Hymenobacter busanensis]QHJ06719.1 DUF2256 domain-containing protein [Hymenobacter busanensis]
MPAAALPSRLVKGQLPTKLCRSCGRPFEYRHKWRNCWAEVQYCSERCRRQRPPGSAATPAAT